MVTRINVLIAFVFSISSASLLWAQDLEVIDANGDRIGKVLGISTISRYGAGPPPYGATIIELDGRFVPVYINENAFIGTNHTQYFSSADCTGTPFLEDGSLFSATSVHPPGMTLYAEDPDATIRSVQLSSHIDTGNTCQSTSERRDVVPAIPLADLSENFTPPFRLVPETIITLVSPSTAPAGTRIKLVGKGFSVGMAEVMFNDEAGLNVEVINDTALLVTVPSLPIGPVDITINTGGGGTATLPGDPGGFTVGVLAAAIPTLMEWGTALLVMGLLGAGIQKLMRKRLSQLR